MENEVKAAKPIKVPKPKDTKKRDNALKIIAFAKTLSADIKEQEQSVRYAMHLQKSKKA